MSVKYRHLLLLFYKISIPIYAFLPALQTLKDTSAEEVRFRSSQPASHGFLNCLFSLIVVTSGDLSRSLTIGSLGGQNPDCRMDERAIPSRSFELSARLDVQYEASRCHVEG
jgi:hypothetical protein